MQLKANMLFFHTVNSGMVSGIIAYPLDQAMALETADAPQVSGVIKKLKTSEGRFAAVMYNTEHFMKNV